MMKKNLKKYEKSESEENSCEDSEDSEDSSINEKEILKSLLLLNQFKKKNK